MTLDNRPNHGTPARYGDGGCRCSWCRSAWAAYRRREIGHADRVPAPPPPPECVIVNGPAAGMRIPADSPPVVYDTAGNGYASHKMQAGLVGYVWKSRP